MKSCVDSSIKMNSRRLRQQLVERTSVDATGAECPELLLNRQIADIGPDSSFSARASDDDDRSAIPDPTALSEETAISSACLAKLRCKRIGTHSEVNNSDEAPRAGTGASRGVRPGCQRGFVKVPNLSQNSRTMSSCRIGANRAQPARDGHKTEEAKLWCGDESVSVTEPATSSSSTIAAPATTPAG